MIKAGLVGLILFFQISPFSFAEKTEQIDYETTTLRLYNEQKWDSLLIIGEEAISKEYDYFYIRARVGRAAFELHLYVKAAKHFEKALEFNDIDPFSVEYLYYAYRYSGRDTEARFLLSRFPGQLVRSLGKPDRMPVLYIEAGPAFTNHISSYDDNHQKSPGSYSEVYLNRNSQYLLAGIAQPVNYRIRINVAAALLNFNKKRTVNITGLDSLSGDYSVKQWEAYLSPIINLNKKISISPAFRLIGLSYENPLQSEDPTVQRLIGPQGIRSYNDYAAGGEITYSTPYLSYSMGAWQIHVDKTDNTQLSGNIFARPNGNLNFYLSTSISLNLFKDTTRLLINQLIGGKVFKNLWGEAFFTLGDLSNTAEQNIQVVYNAFEKIKYRTGTRLVLNVNDYLKLSFRYQVFFREGTELFYQNESKFKIFSYNYQSHSITGGITWNLH
ncbi:MAG: hypothetical protein CVU14_01610 [Bacteroidetes bacterium HGW-Bacteroidetes-9]|jgi:tetratricopeptide (TPR) repeat protein|nr:MAG: hypothetical protein CVU14_01610 [Bacteroidetes bacterium HGW-Bacteroidetes-9]